MGDGHYYLRPELYDAVYADVTGDLAAHLESLRAAAGPSLEVCCGNGRLLIPALDAGLACEGLDREAAMLANLESKLAARGLHATLHQADMRDFDLPGRYALITIPFNSFLHNLTQADQLATLNTCRRHLAPGGRLELVVFHPSAAKLMEWDGIEKFLKEMAWDTRRIRVHDRADDDRIEQIRNLTRRIEVLEGARVVDQHVLTFALRYIYKPEMELLLRTAGFARWTVDVPFADFRDATPLPAGRPLQEGDTLRWTAWED